MSPDGQMIFFTENPIIFEEGQFYTVQGMAGLPPLPLGRTMIGQGYSLVATPGTPVITGSVSIQYLSNDVLVAGADEDGLTLYFWDGSSWSDLPTTRDAYYNLATAPSQGVGVYALMSSIQIPLETPGWNLFSYPAPTRPVTQALLSISGYYTTVYGHEPTDTADPWKVYDVTVPPFVNDLTALEFNHAYWINISQAITLHVSGGPTPAFNPTTLPPSPPATFYGAVLSGPGFTPTPGMVVSAWINGVPCGQGQTLTFAAQVVYVVDVFAEDTPGGNSGCGAPGRTVTFRVGSQPMATTAPWDNSQVWNLPLIPDTQRRVYLPVIRRE